jgi:rhodanese-related sulfurtransferase
LVSCGNNEEINNIISGTEARILYESNENVILLDVRSPEEFEAFHLENSILIPAGEIESRLFELPDKEAIIIVYCKAGIRSSYVVEILLKNEYTNVYDMQSIDNWFNPLERELLNEIEKLTERLEAGTIDDFDLEDVYIPEGWHFCGRCSGCSEVHMISDMDYFNEHYNHEHNHQHTPCGSCDDIENCVDRDCENCENGDDCEHYDIHIHDEDCDHEPDE